MHKLPIKCKFVTREEEMVVKQMKARDIRERSQDELEKNLVS